MIYYNQISDVHPKYETGMYGGKFLPMHSGHHYCLDVAASLCRKVYFILFYGGDQEMHTVDTVLDSGYLSLDARRFITQKLAKAYGNVVPVLIDVTNCKKPDGTEDWDAETPLVLNRCGNLDAVFSSEPSYNEYFSRAYPKAEHILVDPPRIVYPVSGTMLRGMTRVEAIEKGMEL